MLSVGSATIFLHRAPTDMRKSFEGLSGLVEREFPGQLLSGSLFVFVNRRRNLLKLLYWDGDGLAQWYNYLSSYCTSSCRGEDSCPAALPAWLTRGRFARRSQRLQCLAGGSRPGSS